MNFPLFKNKMHPEMKEKNVILGENVQQKTPPAPLTGWGKKVPHTVPEESKINLVPLKISISPG